MRRTTILLAACLLLVGAAVGCSQEKSYDAIVRDCAQALKDRAADDKSKPAACKGVKEKDYDTLVMGQVLDDGGWVDDDGNVNPDKLLEGATSEP